MKTIQKYILTVLVLSATVGCKERMIELNSNPNIVSSTNMQYLFTGATENFDNRGRGEMIDKVQSAMQIMQYASRYGEGDVYIDPVTPGSKQVASYGNYYGQYYSQGNQLYTLLREIEAKPENMRESFNDIKAITKTLLAYQQWRVLQQYGAMVYLEAFKAQTNGITLPKYDKGQNIYKDIDALFKEAIAILSLPKVVGTVELGKNDFFNGYTNTPIAVGGGSTVVAQANYDIQRAMWLKFANMARLEMAWKIKATDAAFFETVKTEVLAVPAGFMTKIEEGTYFNYRKEYDNNPDDVDIITQQFAISEPFCNTLIALKDPRLQYLARPTGLSDVNSFNYRAMQKYYADTLAAYGDLFNGKHVFVGHAANPKFKGKSLVPVDEVTPNNPNFPGLLTKSFTLVNPNFPNPLTMIDSNGEEKTITLLEKFTLELQIVSPIQTRYFIKCGGKGDKNGSNAISNDVNALRYDGKGGEWDGIVLRRPIFTYAQQCFMFAYLGISLDGKAPADWYEKGVKAAMQELRADALRYRVQVAVSEIYPAFPGFNPDGLYTYDDAAIDAYIAANPYSLENTVCQAWIYFYQAPEKAYEWWKLTGLPKMVKNATPAAAAAQTSAYLETPYKLTADVVELLFPRRGTLPDRQTVNEINFMAVKDMLEAEPGFMEWSSTQGRIWWDK